MDWQLALSFVAIGLAGLYIAQRGWRTWRASKSGCSSGCGCSSSKKPDGPALIPADQLVLRKNA